MLQTPLPEQAFGQALVARLGTGGEGSGTEEGVGGMADGEATGAAVSGAGSSEVAVCWTSVWYGAFNPMDDWIAKTAAGGPTYTSEQSKLDQSPRHWQTSPLQVP